MKRLTMLLFLCPSFSFANIGFDAASSATDGGHVFTTLSWSHTSTGNNLVLTVGCNAGNRTTTSVTYNSVAMTKATSFVYDAGGSEISLWYLKSPSTGTNTVLATFSGTPPGANCGGITLTEVDQTSPLEATQQSSGTGTSQSLSITTVNNNAWVVDAIGDDLTGGPFVASAGQTRRYHTEGVNTDGAGSTKGPVSPAGPTTMSWSNASVTWGLVAASFKPKPTVVGWDPLLLTTEGE